MIIHSGGAGIAAAGGGGLGPSPPRGSEAPETPVAQTLLGWAGGLAWRCSAITTVALISDLLTT